MSFKVNYWVEKSCFTEIVCSSVWKYTKTRTFTHQVTFPGWSCEKFSPFFGVSLCDFYVSTSFVSISPLSVGTVHNDGFRTWLPLPALPAGACSTVSFLRWSCRRVWLYGWWLGALCSRLLRLLHLLHAAPSSHRCVLTNVCRSWCVQESEWPQVAWCSLSSVVMLRKEQKTWVGPLLENTMW